MSLLKILKESVTNSKQLICKGNFIVHSINWKI